MYKHLVLWKLKSVEDRSEFESRVEGVVERFRALPKYIPEIVECEVGVNVGDYGASFFDISLCATFNNREEFWRYTQYAEHDAALDFLRPLLEEEQIVDYVI